MVCRAARSTVFLRANSGTVFAQSWMDWLTSSATNRYLEGRENSEVEPRAEVAVAVIMSAETSTKGMKRQNLPEASGLREPRYSLPAPFPAAPLLGETYTSTITRSGAGVSTRPLIRVPGSPGLAVAV